MMLKSLLAFLPLAAIGLAIPTPQGTNDLVPVKTVDSGEPSTVQHSDSQVPSQSTSTSTSGHSDKEQVPQNGPELIAILVKLDIDIGHKLTKLNDTAEHSDHTDKKHDADLIEAILHEVIVLVENVVALLGRVVVGLIHCTDDEVTQIVAILVKIIAQILFTVGFVIKSLQLGGLLGAVLALVANVLVLLLKVVATLVPGVLALVAALLKELGLLQLVGSLLGAVLSLLNIIL